MAERIDIRRRHILRAGALAAAAGLGMSGAAADPGTPARMPSLAGATGWLDTPPLQPAALRGKVVLINFCTYTCINWLRCAHGPPRTALRAW